MGRQILLPTEAETGGYKGIWKKTLHLFHYLTHSKLGQQYDWVFKGDDDTFVSLPQIRRVLREFDSRVPIFLGNNGYGVGCRGIAPASPFYWQNKGTTPCHGGAGYVLSRSLMQLMGPHFLDCSAEWPSSSYEDATMAFCLLRHSGVGCTGMKGDFGWDRYHNAKRDKVAMKLDALEATPAKLASAISFHPVPPVYQLRISNTLTKLREELSTEIEDAMVATFKKSKRYLVSQWNCTVPLVDGENGKPFNALCQQYPLKAPPLAALPHERSKKSLRVQGVWPSKSIQRLSPGLDGVSADTVIVAATANTIYGHGSVQSRALVLLVKTLRATGCNAKVRTPFL